MSSISFFMRGNLGDAAPDHRLGVQTASPDIIPVGTKTPNDINALTNYLNYSNPKLAHAIEFGKTNYIYVRGKNIDDQKSFSGVISLYQVSAENVTDPTKWVTLTSANSTEVNVEPGDIAVVGPFSAMMSNNSDTPGYLVALVTEGADPTLLPTENIPSLSTWVIDQGGASLALQTQPKPAVQVDLATLIAPFRPNLKKDTTLNFTLMVMGGSLNDIVSVAIDSGKGQPTILSYPIKKLDDPSGLVQHVEAASGYQAEITIKHTILTDPDHIAVPPATITLTIYDMTVEDDQESSSDFGGRSSSGNSSSVQIDQIVINRNSSK